jgi:hypothetical protein
MAHEVAVNFGALRKQLARQIKALEKAVELGAGSVKAAKAEGKKARLNANKKNLASAQRVLRKLKSQEAALADECCDTGTQNCNFVYL